MDIQFKSIQGNLFIHHRVETHREASLLHYHDAYELYFLLEGERNYLTHSKIYPISPGWITLTRPYVVHGTNGGNYERILISFTEDFLSTYFQPTLIDVFHEVFSVDAIPAQTLLSKPQIKELFCQIVENADSNDLRMTALNLGTLLLLLYDLVKHVPTETNKSTLSTQMQDILAYVSNNIATIKSLEQVANHFYVSKYYLAHQFKKSTGFTFIEFLTKVKLSHALFLLKQTDDNIADISKSCGFETPTYFGVVFKKNMHMTPLQYRTWIKSKDAPTTQE